MRLFQRVLLPWGADGRNAGPEDDLMWDYLGNLGSGTGDSEGTPGPGSKWLFPIAVASGSDGQVTRTWLRSAPRGSGTWERGGKGPGKLPGSERICLILDFLGGKKGRWVRRKELGADPYSRAFPTLLLVLTRIFPMFSLSGRQQSVRSSCVTLKAVAKSSPTAST